MANIDNPFGFKPIGSLISGSDGLHTSEYILADANTVCGVGDLVELTTAGRIDVCAASATQIVGVAAQAADASSGDTILVYDDPFAIFIAQMDDGSGTGTGLAQMYGNFDFVATAATDGLSNMEIDEDSQAATATLPLKAIGLYDGLSGKAANAYGEFQITKVIINNHVYKSLGVTGLT